MLLEEKLENLKASTIQELEKCLSSKVDELLEEIHKENAPETTEPHQNGSKDQPDGRRKRTLVGKVFITRNSILTEMWSTPHFSSFYNICAALFIMLIINTGLLYLADNERFSGDVEFLAWTFGKVSSWISIWIGMNMGEMLVLYPLYRLWAYTRVPTPKIGYFDKMFGGVFIIYLTLFMFFPPYYTLEHDLPPLSTLFTLMEQSRIMMKTYAFVRENVPKTLNYKPHQDGDAKNPEPCPEFQKFLYFLFAPTLVYRDEYPRTPKIHWNYVLWNFLQVIATILATFMAFRRFVVVIFSDVGQTPFNLAYFVMVLSGSCLVGAMSMFCGFYGLLHCWHNAFAEMLRFGDRHFYHDWWNATSFLKYYRTWNTIVHDFFFNYVYRDVYEASGKRQQPAMVAVLFISAIYHEFIMGLTLRFCYPVMFAMFFIIGATFANITRNSKSAGWNIFLWWSLISGWGLFIVFYCMEWYARVNCPRTLELPLDYFVPRSWTCKVLHIPFLESIFGD